MAFKDLKALGGTPEFQEMMKKLLAEQDAEKTQDAAETPVADKIETDVDDKTAANIEEDLKNQKREIISLVNSMLGKRDKKSTQVSLTKISSRLTSIDIKLTRILTSITNIGKTISKSYDLQKQRFDNYELDKAKRVDDTKEASRGGKGYTAVKSVDSGGLLKYLPFLLMAGAFLTGFISKWFEGKKEDILKIFAPITSIFLVGGKFGKLVGNVIYSINDAVFKFKETITSATKTIGNTLDNLTKRFLSAIGKGTKELPRPPTTPQIRARNLAGQPAMPANMVEAQNIVDKGPPKKFPGGTTPPAGVSRATFNAERLATYSAQEKVFNAATKMVDEFDKGAANFVKQAGGAYTTPREAAKGAFNSILRLGFGNSGRINRARIAETLATDKRLASFLRNMKRFKIGLLGSGLVASSVIGSKMSGDPLIGAAGGAAAFGALVVALKKIKGAAKWLMKWSIPITILISLTSQIIETGQYYMSNPKSSAEDEKKFRNLCISWYSALGGLAASLLLFITSGVTVGAAAAAIVGLFVGTVTASTGIGLFVAPAAGLIAGIGAALLIDKQLNVTAVGEAMGLIVFKMHTEEYDRSRGMAEILALFANIPPEAAKRALDMGETGADIGNKSMVGYAAMFNIGTMLDSMRVGKSPDKDDMKRTNDTIRSVGSFFGGGIGLALGLGKEKLSGLSGQPNTDLYNYVAPQDLKPSTLAPAPPPAPTPPASRPQASTPPTRRPPASNPSRSSGSGFGNIAAEKGCSPADLMCIFSVN